MLQNTSFKCPACGKNAVILLIGYVNVLIFAFTNGVKCRECKSQLEIIKGTKRLLITCAITSWVLAGVVTSVLPHAGVTFFIICIWIPIIFDRRFFAKKNG